MNRGLGLGLGFVISGAAIGSLELNQASTIFFRSQFSQWSTLFVFGFFGTFLLASSSWYDRKIRRSRVESRRLMKATGLQMGAFIVVSIGALATLNEDRTHVYGAGVPFWTNAFAAFVSGIISAGLITVGILVVARSFRAQGSLRRDVN